MINNILFFTQGMALASVAFCTLYFLVLAPVVNRPQRIMGYILLLATIENLKDLPLLFSDIAADDWSRNMLFVCDIVIIPPCVFFTKELMCPGWLTMRRVIEHEWPFLLLILSYSLTALPPLQPFSCGILYVCMTYCLAYTLYNIYILNDEAKRFNLQLREYYSYTDNLDITWMRRLLIFFMLYMLIYAISVLFYSAIGDIVYYVCVIALWMVIFYYANRQQVAVEIAKQSVRVAEPCLSTPPSFADTLCQLMHEEKLFLNPRLTLSDVAIRVGTNRTYLSQYINQTYSVSFLDYINNLRLEHAISLLGTHGRTIADVAEQSGFSSLVTFRRYFKSRYGCTPGEYISVD